ncbi:MAG TPA: site-2 protease family protein [Gaiellaceae bacterium]
MSDHDVERRFKDLPIEEQRALLASMGEPWRDYEPIQPRGTDWRGIFRKIWAPIAALIGLAVKFGFIFLKFFGIFISVGAYALLWGWKFGVGLVLLILVHELGHFFVAKAQGLDVTLPTFVPFIGAYVLIKNQPQDPWHNSLVALAGPAVGSLGAAACWAIGSAGGSNLWLALAYSGFLLNLINLVPVGIFDGGAVARAWSAARRSGSPAAFPIGFLYLALVALLIAGMWATHVPQHRL